MMTNIFAMANQAFLTVLFSQGSPLFYWLKTILVDQRSILSNKKGCKILQDISTQFWKLVTLPNAEWGTLNSGTMFRVFSLKDWVITSLFPKHFSSHLTVSSPLLITEIKIEITSILNDLVETFVLTDWTVCKCKFPSLCCPQKRYLD